jgi:two-component system, NtrC family, nitrogen regulation sensor histidine kinase NtrY
MASVNSASKVAPLRASGKTPKFFHPGTNGYAVSGSSARVLRPKLILRLLGICLLGCLTGFLIFDSPYWMAGIWTGLATTGLFYETVRFVDQSERKLTSFLQAINQGDFSVTFYENKNTGEYDLHHAFNELSETFKVLRSEKESQHQLLQIIVETAAVPMICFEEGTGKVHIINEAAKQLLNIQFLMEVKNLWRVDRTLPDFLFQIHDGDKESLKLVLHGKQHFLSVTSQHIVFKSKNLKLTAFHDVSSELATKEAETWQKLLRVLTHEISNSAIPLSTLSAFIYDMVSVAETEMRGLSEENRKDLLLSLKTIEQRSRSLKEFVQNFRSVNQVPEPVVELISLERLVEEVHALFHKEALRENIHFSIAGLKHDLTIHADKNLTMQVMINLIKNAMEAMANMKEGKSIFVNAEKMGRFVNVRISDTGCGISAEDLDQVFIPFYSTKKSGSGIGLSISQQIMQKQKGDITVRSEPGKGAEFILTFSC